MPSDSQQKTLKIKNLGLVDYLDTWNAMKRFTQDRNEKTEDELWLLEHKPVFSQGQAGKPEHIIGDTAIPIINTDRGGQITYHGPGQLVAYILLDLKRLKMGVRDLVTHIESSVVSLLASYDVQGAARADAPGVYVGDRKVASLGLRLRRGCSFHGVAINITTDLRPFEFINPCGYPGMQMVNLKSLVRPDADISMANISNAYATILGHELGVMPL